MSIKRRHLENVEEALDGLDEPDPLAVWRATQQFASRDVAVVAAQRVSPGVLTRTTVEVTDAQIKALPTTAIQLVAAPGVGSVHVVVHAFFHLKDWAADYTNIDGQATIEVRLGTTQIGWFKEIAASGVTGLLAGGGSDGTLGWVYPFQQVVGDPSVIAKPTVGASYFYESDITNKAVNVGATNGSAGNFTGGNAAQSLAVTLLYYTLSF